MSIVLYIVAGFYLVPLLRCLNILVRGVLFLKPQIVTAHTHRHASIFRRFFGAVFLTVARYEYVIHPLRHYLVTLPFRLLVATTLSLYIFGDFNLSLPTALFGALLVILDITTVFHKDTTDLKAAQLLIVFREIHPTDFFNRYKLEFAFGGIDMLDLSGLTAVNPMLVDFTVDNRATLKLLPLFKGIVDTAYITHFCLKVHEVLGSDAVCNMVDSAGSLWGKRVLQLARGKMVVKGVENLHNKHGKFLLIFNHKSMFDFILTFLAVSEIQVAGRLLRPRFILAKDHFRDNKIVYSVMGLGKLCEAMGMVFISRRERGKSFEELKRAAKFIVEKEVDIAIYPQGTRAEASDDRSGKRRDAGFYTTIGKKPSAETLAHLKKGTGYLVYDTLCELNTSGLNEPLNLVFVGIKGAGATLPKGSLKVQTENTIEFIIDAPLTLSGDVVLSIQNETDAAVQAEKMREFATDINTVISERLAAILGIHQTLATRYLTELKGQFRYDNDKIALVQESLRKLSKDSSVVFQILDRIYALPVAEWNGFLSALSQLLLDRPSPERLGALLTEVSESLLKVA